MPFGPRYLAWCPQYAQLQEVPTAHAVPTGGPDGGPSQPVDWRTHGDDELLLMMSGFFRVPIRHEELLAHPDECVHCIT